MSWGRGNDKRRRLIIRDQFPLAPQDDILYFMNNNKTNEDVLSDDSPMEIINIDDLEKEEPEDSTVSTSDYGDDVDDTTPTEAEETIEKADDIVAEDEKEHPGY